MYVDPAQRSPARPLIIAKSVTASGGIIIDPYCKYEVFRFIVSGSYFGYSSEHVWY